MRNCSPPVHSPPVVCLLSSPEKFIEIAVLHVLKDHDERVSVHTHAVKLHYVLMLEVGQQLSLTLEILPGCKSGVLQSLESERERALNIL